MDGLSDIITDFVIAVAAMSMSHFGVTVEGAEQRSNNPEAVRSVHRSTQVRPNAPAPARRVNPAPKP